MQPPPPPQHLLHDPPPRHVHLPEQQVRILPLVLARPRITRQLFDHDFPGRDLPDGHADDGAGGVDGFYKGGGGVVVELVQQGAGAVGAAGGGVVRGEDGVDVGRGVAEGEGHDGEEAGDVGGGAGVEG